MEKPGKIYFASDVHLGAPDPESSLVREKIFVRWLDKIKDDANKTIESITAFDEK